MNLTEPQKRMLKTMLEFDCGIHVYEGMQFTNAARARFHGRVARHPTRRFVFVGTVRALLNRELIEEPGAPWESLLGHHDYFLTPKGREIAKELQDARKD